MISALIEVAVSMVKLFIGLIKLIVKVVLGAMLIDWYIERRATRKKVNQYWTEEQTLGSIPFHFEGGDFDD